MPHKLIEYVLTEDHVEAMARAICGTLLSECYAKGDPVKYCVDGEYTDAARAAGAALLKRWRGE